MPLRAPPLSLRPSQSDTGYKPLAKSHRAEQRVNQELSKEIVGSVSMCRTGPGLAGRRASKTGLGKCVCISGCLPARALGARIYIYIDPGLLSKPIGPVRCKYLRFPYSVTHRSERCARNLQCGCKGRWGQQHRRAPDPFRKLQLISLAPLVELDTRRFQTIIIRVRFEDSLSN